MGDSLFLPEGGVQMKRQHRLVTILVLSLVVLAVSGTVFLSFAMGDETDIVTIDISQTKSYYKVGDATLGTGQILSLIHI